jgi:glycyl-radical enzyme activating protein
MKGLVFNILNCSLNDGPGVRTTIFLKGCPLRCIWCHNPESQKFEAELSFYSEKCVGCMACVKVCKNGCHTFIDGNHFINRANCQKCFACVDACPVSALKIEGELMEAEDVAKKAMKDKEYFTASGGGITISGGEPLSQINFIYELLKIFKENEIHTAIETSGMAKTENLIKIMSLTDLFLYDYKGTEEELHKKNTGVSNKTILKNLDFLYKSGKDIILRCPLVEGVNDTETHLYEIANIREKYPKLRAIEIMPYHNMGDCKNERIGKKSLYNAENASNETKEKWLKILHSNGDESIVMN